MKCLIFAIASIASAQTIVISAGTVIDGKGAVLRNQQIVVEGSKITAVRRGNAHANYDLRGFTVMPGWIDTHVHITWHFNAEHKYVGGREDPKELALYTAENAWLTLWGGFTTVQSVGAPMDVDVRNRINQGSLPGPRILTSVRQINSMTAKTPEEYREFVRKTKAESRGFDQAVRHRGHGRGRPADHDGRADPGRLQRSEGGGTAVAWCTPFRIKGRRRRCWRGALRSSTGIS